MSNKGFTLIELLAMMVVLGILMAVSIPNITGILNNQKDNTIVEDAIRMTDKVKTILMTSKEVKLPSDEGHCVALSLDYLDLSEEIVKGPNSEYNRANSYVVVTLKDNEYKYYVSLFESDDNYGIKFASLEDINKRGNSIVSDNATGTFASVSGEVDCSSGFIKCKKAGTVYKCS